MELSLSIEIFRPYAKGQVGSIVIDDRVIALETRDAVRVNRTEEALEQARLAVRADPASANLTTVYAIELAHSKRYDEAIATFLEALEFELTDSDIRLSLADAYEKSGKFDLAAAELEKAYKLSSKADLGDQFRKDYARIGYEQAAKAARHTELRRELQDLHKKSAQGKYVSPTAYVYVYAGLRDKENTL